jgi:prepilin-type N-terminal cleavage/methylation domain-containing protein
MRRGEQVKQNSNQSRQQAFSLVELLTALVLMGIVAAYVIPRVGGQHETAKKNACWTQRGEIELQAQLWRRNHGAFPQAGLGDVGADTNYFAEGVPTCPVDGTSYTIDTASGRVVGHEH